MRGAPDLIAVGTSLGGLHALLAVFGALPGNLPVPIVMVQHRGPTAETTLVDMLARGTALTVVEAEDKLEMQPGTVYVAPPDYHLLVEERGTLALSTEAPVRAARPSIDVLFESAADAYRERLVGVLLTGASADGAAGLARIKQLGGCAIVQDPATAECAVMPAAGIAATAVDYILPLDRIGAHVASLVEGTRV
jgi:two-component system, chemotaxis family, protein-glutamate methylesterase/glutaminase